MLDVLCLPELKADVQDLVSAFKPKSLEIKKDAVLNFFCFSNAFYKNINL